MSAPSNYVLGQSTHEYERLMLQGRLLRPYTEKYFRAAGVGPGMRVLDLGSGMGDVALLAADIVGPGGRVVGLDRDGVALKRAGERTVEQGCSSWVTFQATNLEDFATTDLFDAVIGRYILLYQPDAGGTIRQLTKFLKPGGIVVFHELDFPDPHPSFPVCELFDQVYALIGEAFLRAGAPPDFGRRVGKAFLDAGLPFPTIVADAVIGGGRGSYVYRWLSNTLFSVAPRLKDLGIEVPPGLVVDHELASRLEEAALAAGSQILAPTQYGAWTRKPL
jgi:ubiquinone/menaquinone biosynthesis C-methylase UbiE